MNVAGWDAASSSGSENEAPPRIGRPGTYRGDGLASQVVAADTALVDPPAAAPVALVPVPGVGTLDEAIVQRLEPPEHIRKDQDCSRVLVPATGTRIVSLMGDVATHKTDKPSSCASLIQKFAGIDADWTIPGRKLIAEVTGNAWSTHIAAQIQMVAGRCTSGRECSWKAC